MKPLVIAFFILLGCLQRRAKRWTRRKGSRVVPEGFSVLNYSKLRKSSKQGRASSLLSPFDRSLQRAVIRRLTLVLMSAMASAGREVMQVKKLSEFAVIPTRGSEFSAGFDLASAYDLVVPAHGKAIVKTDLAIAIPLNTYARIAPRSGLAVKNFIDTGAGVVDYDYRGNVGVVLFNHGDDQFEVKRGDRVAQLILERICMAEVEETEELFETARGQGGFGSTGVAQAASSSSSSESESEAKRAKTDPV